MKTAEGLMSRISQIARQNGNIQNKAILNAIKEFEMEVKSECIAIFNKSLSGKITSKQACDLLSKGVIK